MPGMRPFDLLLQLPLFSTPVGHLLAFSLAEGRCPSLSFGGFVDPSYVDAVIFLLDPTVPFAAKPPYETSQGAPACILEVNVVCICNVGLVERVGSDALVGVVKMEQVQEGRQAVLGVLLANSVEIGGDGVGLAKVAFGLGMLAECILITTLLLAGRAIPVQAAEALWLVYSSGRERVTGHGSVGGRDCRIPRSERHYVVVMKTGQITVLE